jgi:Flp pilus assembly protein TadD
MPPSRIPRGCAGAALAVVLALSTPTAATALTAQEKETAYYASYTGERVQKYGYAITMLAPILAATPNDYMVNLRLGWLNYLQGSFDESVVRYRKAVQAAPASIEAKLGLMMPLMAQNKDEEAIDLGREILTADRYSYYANLRLAALYRKQQKLDRAERTSRDMLALYPLDVAFLTELAWTKAAQQDAAAASSLFSEIQLLDPDNAAAKQHFAPR